jgi:arabinose-5-phosphate isomerase
MLERGADWSGKQASDIMTEAPKTIAPEALAVEALSVLQEHSITQLAVVSAGKFVGMIHLHDLVREGLH